MKQPPAAIRPPALVDAIANERGPILVLTGAGISLASGIPTFRGTDEGAVWSRDVTELGTYRYFLSDPVGSWKWYRRRFLTAMGARPNAAHSAVAELERWYRDRGRTFFLVTQNIDTLHEQAGSAGLIKVHGSADRARCSSLDCPASSTTTIAMAELDFPAFDLDPRLETIPRCPECRSLMRPHVLWFDEVYTSHAGYRWPSVLEACESMRLVLAVGTSFSVGVTEKVRKEAKQRRARMFVVDPNAPTGAVDPDAVYIRAKSEELLPLVVATLLSM